MVSLYVMIVVILVVYGLILGSFINAYVYRLHAKLEQPLMKKRVKAKAAGLPTSVMQGRSVCAHCGHVLAARDLVPVLSYIWLKGRCRYCHVRYSDTPLPELLVPISFVLSYYFWPQPIAGTAHVVQFCLWLVVLLGFAALTLYDLRWYILPDKIVAAVIIASLAFFEAGLAGQSNSGAHLLGLAASAVLLPGFFASLFYGSKGTWIGGGDVKLAVALALLVPSGIGAALVLFSASAVGVLASLPQLVKRQKTLTSRLAFGPLLMLGTILAVLFEAVIRRALYL